MWRGSDLARPGTATNRRGKVTLCATLLAVLALAPTADTSAAQEPEGEEAMAQIEKRLEEARERLALTDAQVEQLVPLLVESLQATMAVFEEHGIDLRSMAEGSSSRPNLRRLRALRGDLDEVQEALYEKIEEADFLSEEQFAEFKKMQEEQREALRERLRGGGL